MAKVYLGLGSNIKPQQHLTQAIHELKRYFGTIDISPIYESEPVGFDGANFLNLVVAISTNMSVGELQAKLKQLENNSGRDRNTPKFSARTLDIDILLYDSVTECIDGVHLPREEILHNAFVLRPLSDIAPQLIHPTALRPIHQLWNEFHKSSQALWPAQLQLPE